MKKVVTAKFHGITVTEANLNYHGSITLDPEYCEAAGIMPLEYVDIWNKNSGARISTYVIYGDRGAKQCILNGAAARTCQQGDQVIICASDYMTKDEIFDIAPKILTFDDENNVVEMLSYHVDHGPDGRVGFRILDEKGERLGVPLTEDFRLDEAS